jgi:hypothetical protein
MSNYTMQIDFFGNSVRADTAGSLVSLTDLARAGNMWRATRGLQVKTLQAVVESVGFQEFVKVAQADMPTTKVLQVCGSGTTKRTMAHVIVAVYFAEQFSVEFHYEVIKTFVSGKLLEFRDYGGTEFKALNLAIDMYLPEREGKDNKGVFIQVAKTLRARILGEDATAGAWDTATVAQTHARYESEKKLSGFLQARLVRDFDHLKELVTQI